MAHIRMILTLSIAILAVNNVLVEAGKGREERKANLEARAEVHKKTLKLNQVGFENKFGTMTKSVQSKLTEINYAIIDRILGDSSFPKYLKNVFDILQKYAERQIKKRFKKLKKVYKKWENRNFPDKKKKSKALNILQKQQKEENKPKKNKKK